MGDVVRCMSWSGENQAEAELLLRREWLVTNGLGGYASGTIGGVPTRRYHGLLIAALPAPLGRMVMLRHLREQLRFPDGTVVQIGGEEHAENDLEMPSELTAGSRAFTNQSETSAAPTPATASTAIPTPNENGT